MTRPTQPPTAADVAVLIGIVAGSAVAVRLGGGAAMASLWPWALGGVVVSTLVFGLPALAFVLERGRATLAWMTGLGALAGALPLPLLGLSGAVGLYVRQGGIDAVTWAFDLGVPIPAAGVIYWPRFLRLETQAILLGAASALMFWLVMVRTAQSRGVNILLALFVLGTLVTVATALR